MKLKYSYSQSQSWISDIRRIIKNVILKSQSTTESMYPNIESV